MALKRQQQMLATFSMASMTDVVFLLLVFFMVTSSFVFPTALEIDLPQSGHQTRKAYGKIVELLNLGAENSIKMVLATKPTAPQSTTPEQQ